VEIYGPHSLESLKHLHSFPFIPSRSELATMKIYSLLLSILAAQVLAAPVSSDETFSEVEILKELLVNPQLLPETSTYLWHIQIQICAYSHYIGRNVLTYRVQQFANNVEKRSPQLMSPGLLAGTLGTIQAAMTSFSAPDPRAPKSTVAEVQSIEAKTWAGSKAVKVRYGPYRIPPTSVCVSW
jgi:hypothetical protein